LRHLGSRQGVDDPAPILAEEPARFGRARRPRKSR
jgi:hypothetical protein